MTTLYHTVLIESAEQAEALPDGAVLIREGHFAFQKYKGRFVSADPHDLPVGAAWEVIGWSALVSIEAEEEHRPAHWMDAYYPNAPKRMQTRYVTPWEAV